MSDFLKNNKKLLITVLIHFIITFINDYLYLDFNKINVANYLICKLFLIFILCIIWYYIFKLFKSKNLKKIVKLFLIYFIPVFIVFLSIYPGIWYSDDFHLLFCTKNIEFLYSLNYLTSVFYSICLMLLPFPSGIIIIQLILFSCILTYLVYSLSKKYKLYYLIYIPFFFPMSVFYVLYPNRPLIYGLFYFLFFIITFLDLEQKNNKISFLKELLLCFLVSIISFWRSEGIYLLIFGPLIIASVYYKLSIKKLFVVFLKCLIIFLVIGIPQNINTKWKEKNYSFNRFLPSIVNPMQWMITQDLKGKNIDDDLKNINKILDLDLMKEYSTLDDTPCIWKNNCIKEYKSSDIEHFKKAYIDIVLNNTSLFLKAKYTTFHNASGFVNNTFISHDIFDSEHPNILTFLNDYPINNPINKNLRTKIVALLEGRRPNSFAEIKIYKFINNLRWPLLTSILLFIFYLIKKEYFKLMFPTILLVHSALIFITAPASYFMYYYPVYLCGFFLLFYCIIKCLRKKES